MTNTSTVQQTAESISALSFVLDMIRAAMWE